MPAALVRLVRRPFEMCDIKPTGMSEDITDATHAKLMQPLQFLVRRIRRQHDDGTEWKPQRRAKFKLAAVVGAVDAGLNRHKASDTQNVIQFSGGRDTGLCRRVVPIGNARKARQVAEQMHVTVGSVVRQLKGRRYDIGIWRQAELGHGIVLLTSGPAEDAARQE